MTRDDKGLHAYQSTLDLDESFINNSSLDNSSISKATDKAAHKSLIKNVRSLKSSSRNTSLNKASSSKSTRSQGVKSQKISSRQEGNKSRDKNKNKKQIKEDKTQTSLYGSQSPLIAHIVVDIQTPFLGKVFDYVIPQELETQAQEGSVVKVPFGHRTVSGVIWKRDRHSDSGVDALKSIKKVITPGCLVSASMREDIDAIACHFGGTSANIVRLAIPPRRASIDKLYSTTSCRLIDTSSTVEKNSTTDAPSLISSSLQTLAVSEDNSPVINQRIQKEKIKSLGSLVRNIDYLEKITTYELSEYENSHTFIEKLEYISSKKVLYKSVGETTAESEKKHYWCGAHEFVWDVLPGINRYAVDCAWIIAQAAHKNIPAICVVPSHEHVQTIQYYLSQYDIPTVVSLDSADSDEVRYRAVRQMAAGESITVIGTRAAMYAPVEGPCLCIVIDDNNFAHFDGFSPYANVREVLKLRTILHGGIYISLDSCRSIFSHYDQLTEDTYQSLTAQLNPIESNPIESTSSTSLETQVSVEDKRSHEFIASTLPRLTCADIGSAKDGPTFHIDKNFASSSLSVSCIEKSKKEEKLGQFADILRDKPISEMTPSDYLWDPRSYIRLSCSVVRGYEKAITRRRPLIQWLSWEKLMDMGDNTAGSRIPHVVIHNIGQILLKKSGPILISIPSKESQDGVICTKCYKLAQCSTCKSPISSQDISSGICRKCHTSLHKWKCRLCDNDGMRTVHIDARTTAQELSTLIKNVPISISSPDQRIPTIEWKPQIIVATQGCEPMLSKRSYPAVVILDLWSFMTSFDIDGRIESLRKLMTIGSKAASSDQDGVVMAVGECDPLIIKSLQLWDSSILLNAESKERAQTLLPPFVTAATLWGQEKEVEKILNEDLTWVSHNRHKAVWGPIPIKEQVSEKNYVFPSVADRVSSIIRVPHERRAELVYDLSMSEIQYRHKKGSGEIRFWMDPKDLGYR